MKRIVLYKEDSYIIVQHISETGIKYPPMTIRKKSSTTQYEADLMLYSIKNGASESDSKAVYFYFVSNRPINADERTTITVRSAP